MKKTVLHSQHIALGARMGEFGGWDMPIQYVGILQEHEQTRTRATVFDICHMGEFEISGPTALTDLANLLTCNLETLQVGQVRYGFMLNEAGGVIDDLTCYRLGEERFMLVVNAGTAGADAEWIQGRLSASTRFEDVSSTLAKLDVQGPMSRKVMVDVLGDRLPELGYFRFAEVKQGDTSWLISRTGYTGEWGYEIYLPVDQAESLWNSLIAHVDCTPGGLGARDTLRLEMGYPLYGHELSFDRTPVDTSGGAFIDMEKHFIGKDLVAHALADVKEQLVGLRFASKRAARQGDRVYVEDKAAGVVTSGSVAPSIGVAVAMAFVTSEYAVPGRELLVEIRGRRFPAEVVGLPFYREGTVRGNGDLK